MALAATISQTLRRVTVTSSSKFGSQLPSQISSLYEHLPLQTSRIIVQNVTIHAGTTQSRLLHSAFARKTQRKIAGPSFPKISARSFSIKSPLLIDQSSSVFMSFSRRQWYYFFGGLSVLSVMTIQYMEINAVEKLLAGVDEAVLKSPTLGVELFSSASALTGSLSRATLASNEPIIDLACKALAKADIDPVIRASALDFLIKIWDAEESHPLIYKHLDVKSIAADFVKTVKKSDFITSSAVLIATALSTRPPSADRAKSLEMRHNALVQVYPILMSSFLGKVASNPSYHPIFIDEGTIPAMIQLAVVEKETAIGVEFFYHLSTLPDGIIAISRYPEINEYLKLASDPSSPMHSIYFDFSGDRDTGLYTMGFLSNGAKHLADPRWNVSDQVSTKEAATTALANKFDLRSELASKHTLNQLSASVLAMAIACIYAPMRGLVRNWWRSYSMTIPQAILHSTWRAAIGAPLLVASSCLISDARKDLKDKRLFITIATLGSTGVMFGLRFVLSAAPFTLFPAAMASFVTFSATSSERTARRRQVTQFQDEARSGGSSDEDELDD